MQDASAKVTPLEPAIADAADALAVPNMDEAAPNARLLVGDAATVSKTYRKGDFDLCGNEIDKIFVKTERFMIYTVANGEDLKELRHSLFLTRYEDALAVRRNLHPTVGRIARIADVLCGMRPTPIPYFSFVNEHRERCWKSLAERCNAFMAQAMQMAIEGKPDKAVQMLAALRQEIESRRDSANKMRYIFANAVTYMMIAFAWLVWALLERDQSVIALLWTGTTPALDPTKPVVLNYRDVMMFGAIGAFFSVSIGLKDIRVNHSITLSEMMYAGMIRVPIGIMAASIVILLVEGGWSPLELGGSVWLYCLLGFLAGFSELFVPNMLKQIETRSQEKTPEPGDLEASSR
jgi:hypothetical protein